MPSSPPAENSPALLPSPHPGGASPPQIPRPRLPRHVAVILDGNGRWATGYGLPRAEGHRAGMLSLLDVIDGTLEIGVAQLSLYVFSTENWRREKAEVRAILGVIHTFVRDHGETLHRKGVRICWSGRRDRLPRPLAADLTRLEHRSRRNTVLRLVVCADYGARDELVRAAAQLAEEAVAGRLRAADIDAAAFSRRLFQPDLADVDLLVRTSGEQRISNFLLWQSAYAEFYFSDVLWPDFDRLHLWAAVREYALRERRFGGAEAAK